MSTLKVDLDLVQKYNVAGPRYTSSHGGQLAPTEFQEASGRWMRDIIAADADLGAAGWSSTACLCRTR